MRKMIVLIFPLAMMGCWSTDQGSTRTYTYTVKNESGTDIIISSYMSYYPDVSPIKMNLLNGEEKTQTYEDFNPPRGYTFQRFFGNDDNQRDSIVIVYGKKKFSSFKSEGCSGSARNPLNFCVYRELQETFVFVKEDYENAEDCNGNCD